MAILTWRELAIPDVGRSRQEGIRTAADLFNKAVGHAQTSVAQIQAMQDQEKAEQTRQADRFVLDRMLAVQDPEQLKQMQADGSLVANAGQFVSPEMLKTLDARAGVLQQRQMAEYNDQRTLQRNAELEAAEKVWDKAAAVALNDPAAAIRIMSQAKFSNAEDQAAFDKRLRDLFIDPAIGQRAEAEKISAAAHGFVRELRENPDPEAQRMMLQEIPNTPEGNKLYAEVLNIMRQQEPNFMSRVAASDATLGFDGSGPEATVSSNRALTRRFNKLEEIAMANGAPPPPGWYGEAYTMGEEIDWDQKYIKDLSKKYTPHGKPSTAGGPYQITNETRLDFIKRHGERLFGTTDPHKVQGTFENERTLAKAIYEETKKLPMEMKDRWAAFGEYKSFPDSFFEDKSFEEVEPVLKLIEGGVLPDNYKDVIDQRRALQEERELDAAPGIKIIDQAAPLKGKTAQQVSLQLAKDLKLEGDAFAQFNTYLIKKINEARREGIAVSEAEVGHALLESLEENGWNWTDIVSGDVELNVLDERFDRLVKTIPQARAGRAQLMKDREKQNQLDQALAEYDKQLLKVRQAEKRAKIQTGAGEAFIKEAKKLEELSEKIRAHVFEGRKSKQQQQKTAPDKAPALSAAEIKKLREEQDSINKSLNKIDEFLFNVEDGQMEKGATLRLSDGGILDVRSARAQQARLNERLQRLDRMLGDAIKD